MATMRGMEAAVTLLYDVTSPLFKKKKKNVQISFQFFPRSL